MRKWTVCLIAACAALTPAATAAEANVREFLAKSGLSRGICVVLGDRKCEQALPAAKAGEVTLLVQLAEPADVADAQRAADEAGLYGARVYVARGKPARIGLANNLADAVVAAGKLTAAGKAEVLRVLRPGGKALVAGETLTKPMPDGADAWSHHYHGPDNNPQSADRLARAPYLTQFVAEPRYGPAPQACVAAGGRVFMAFGHVAWHQREEEWMNALAALNGFNGTLLWRRPLPTGMMVDRCTMIATDKTLYLADNKSCKLLDAATGKPAGEIVIPADLGAGPAWKWIALADGTLYALVGPPDALDDDAKWRRRGHGWPWGGISKGYNAGEYPWGLGSALVAIDPKTKKVLWHHKEADGPIDSRSLCMKAGRIFLAAFGKYLTCLDAKTGSRVWRKTPADDEALFKAMGKFSKGHGYRTGWKSTIYARCTDESLYLMGPQLRKLTAVAAEDGRLMWSLSAKINVHVVIRDDGLYTVGAQGTKGETRKLDPRTGKVLATYDVSRRACTRATGSADGILFRASGGTCRLDVASGKPQWISPMRPSCNVGVIVAHGQLYWQPWVCDCSIQLFGAICLGPAGGHKFDANATDAQRLEVGDAATIAKLVAARKGKAPRKARSNDWCTYLGNNARSAPTTWRGSSVPVSTARAWQARPTAPCEPTAPVVTSNTVYVAGSDGVVRALRADSGKLRWRAYTGGAVRYPPAVDGGKVFVGSDDGWAYCFGAADGRLMWRFRAAPSERRIAVYGRLQSTWPVAGGVLVEGGVAYFAAGMTDYDGTHVYAVDATTGRIKWQNNSSGHLDPNSRRGVALQGHLLSHNGKLYFPGGNAVSPAVYDMKTGKCESRPPTSHGTNARRGRELQVVGGGVRVTGQPLYSAPDHPVYDGSLRWTPCVVAARDANLLLLPAKGKDGARTGRLVATDPFGGDELWSHDLPAAPVRWGLALDNAGRIFVTLRDGQVLCFARAR